jgi:tetratricopeptide (TPR) repeat protein
VSLAFGWLFLIVLLGCAFLARKRYPAITFGLAFFVVASLPSGNFLPCFNGPIYDAYVTIPSIGLAFAFAMVCDILIRQISVRRGMAGSGSLIFMAILGLLVFYRLPVCAAYFRYWAGVWGRPVELMLLTAETRPFQSQAKGVASLILYSEGYIDQAEAISIEVLREVPWDATAKLTLARIAEYREDFATSEKYYRQILDEPKGSMFLKNPSLRELAALLAKNPERSEEEAQLLREFLKGPDLGKHSQAIARLSLIYKDLGNVGKARTTLERGLSLYPHDAGLTKILDSIDHSAPGPETN